MENYIRLAAEAAEESPANQSLVILITGFVVVFLMLLLLIGLIKLYSCIVYAAQNKASSKAKATDSPEEETTASVPTPVVSSPQSDGLDLQTVAVITAAVEAYYGGSKKVRVAGIRPSSTGRSEWANAGLRENIPAMMRTGGLL